MGAPTAISLLFVASCVAPYRLASAHALLQFDNLPTTPGQTALPASGETSSDPMTQTVAASPQAEETAASLDAAHALHSAADGGNSVGAQPVAAQPTTLEAQPMPRVQAASVNPSTTGSLDVSTGGLVAEDLPPGAAALVTGQAPSFASPASGAGSSLNNNKTPAPPPKIGSLISLLNPPPGFQMPPLTEQQKQNAANLMDMRQGLATVVYMRATGPQAGLDMNCGFGYLDDYFKDHFVGIPTAMYRTGELCGLCMRIWCVDSVCEDSLITNRTFMVTDSCQDCRGNDIVTSARGYQWLTGINYNDNPSVQVAWEFTPCGDLLQGGIKMWPSDNNAPVFLGLNFSNIKQLIAGVRINGMQMQRTNYGYWVIDTPGEEIPLRPPYTIELLSANNQRIVARTAALVAQDLGVNF